MKKHLLVLVCCAIFSVTLFAQIEEPARTKDTTKVEEVTQARQPQQQTNPYVKNNKKSGIDKWYFGGSFSFTFGTYTSIGIWPLAGYKVTPKLSFGLQPGYEYIKYNYTNSPDYETSNYGLRVFSRYRVIPQAYFHAEYATINYEFQKPTIGGDYENYREWVPFLFLGAGFSQEIGGSVYAYVQVLFDVLQNENSPYSSWEPFWTVGVSAGF
jgi:hypothetical protein